ncbi:MAG TPA: hypothetical protein QF373_08060, partial [Verrucomicrobiota bacterium]|nr:hypothetical protein [Verrucomicrobiota bacterium]
WPDPKQTPCCQSEIASPFKSKNPLLLSLKSCFSQKTHNHPNSVSSIKPLKTLHFVVAPKKEHNL